jgi:hypothetical protein
MSVDLSSFGEKSMREIPLLLVTIENVVSELGAMVAA